MSRLGKCPVCDGQVATDAASCIHCGTRDFFKYDWHEVRKDKCQTCDGRGRKLDRYWDKSVAHKNGEGPFGGWRWSEFSCSDCDNGMASIVSITVIDKRTGEQRRSQNKVSYNFFCSSGSENFKKGLSQLIDSTIEEFKKSLNIHESDYGGGSGMSHRSCHCGHSCHCGATCSSCGCGHCSCYYG